MSQRRGYTIGLTAGAISQGRVCFASMPSVMERKLCWACRCRREKAPAKRLGQGNLSVRAVGKHRLEEGRFIPLSPQEPFAYISQLKNAYLAKKEGITGVLLKK